MTKKLAALALLIVLAVTAAFGQVPFLGGLPVFDATNFANAIKRHVEMIKQYEQLVLTYEQLTLEYEHFLWMAKQLPGLPRHALSYTPWRYSSSTDIYGTSGGWTQAINTGARRHSRLPPRHRAAPHLRRRPREHPRQPSRARQDKLRHRRADRRGEPARHRGPRPTARQGQGERAGHPGAGSGDALHRRRDEHPHRRAQQNQCGRHDGSPGEPGYESAACCRS